MVLSCVQYSVKTELIQDFPLGSMNLCTYRQKIFVLSQWILWHVVSVDNCTLFACIIEKVVRYERHFPVTITIKLLHIFFILCAHKNWFVFVFYVLSILCIFLCTKVGPSDRPLEYSDSQKKLLVDNMVSFYLDFSEFRSTLFVFILQSAIINLKLHIWKFI